MLLFWKLKFIEDLVDDIEINSLLKLKLGKFRISLTFLINII